MYKNVFLTESQVQSFRDQGYLVVRGLLDAVETRNLIEWTQALQEWPEIAGRHMMYFESGEHAGGKRLLSRVENFMPFHDGLAALINGKKIMGAVSDLLGEPAVLFKDKINYKMAGGDGYKAHQDVQAGWDTYTPFHITAMVAVDATTERNGSLEIAPGWHDKGLIGSHWKPLEDDPAIEYETVHAQPGDGIFFDSYIPHRSGPNLSSDPRRVLYVTFNAASAGDHLEAYYRDKRKSFPPDIEREPDKVYEYKV